MLPLSVFPVRLFTGQCKTSMCDQTSAQFISTSISSEISKIPLTKPSCWRAQRLSQSPLRRTYNAESWFVVTVHKFCSTFGVTPPHLTMLLEESLVSYHLEDNTLSLPFTSSENNSVIRCNKVHCFKYFCMQWETDKTDKNPVQMLQMQKFLKVTWPCHLYIN